MLDGIIDHGVEGIAGAFIKAGIKIDVCT